MTFEFVVNGAKISTIDRTTIISNLVYFKLQEDIKVGSTDIFLSIFEETTRLSFSATVEERFNMEVTKRYLQEVADTLEKWTSLIKVRYEEKVADLLPDGIHVVTLERKEKEEQIF